MTNDTPAPGKLPYGIPIDLATAKKVAAAAEAEAARNGWTVVICVVDSTGHLVFLEKMDQTQYGSIDLARAKAETALDFKRPTKVFEDGIVEGGLPPAFPVGPRRLHPGRRHPPATGGQDHRRHRGIGREIHGGRAGRKRRRGGAVEIFGFRRNRPAL